MFGVAYKDQNGMDLNGVPWLYIDVTNKAECILQAQKMVKQGYQDVIPFESNRRMEEITDYITWDTVKEYQIK